MARAALVPYPAELTAQDPADAKPFVLSKDVALVIGEGVPPKELALDVLRGLIASARPEAVTIEELPKPRAIRVQLVAGPGSPAGGGGDGAAGDDEGYELAISETDVVLSARTAAGLFYGAQTLRQLMPADGEPKLAQVKIRDAPRFPWRGLHLDVSRHFFSAEDVMELLDTMAAFKLNRFHWHLTDDQGWRLPVDDWPKLTEVGAKGVDGQHAYTKEDIKGVIDYAAARHITVVPEIDVPGHVTALLSAYPQFGNSDVPDWQAPRNPRQQWGPGPYTLAPSSDTVAFMRKIFDSVAELFPGDFVHIGGDEVSEAEWKKSEQAQAINKTRGRVQSFFNEKLGEILKDKGRTTVAWDESLHVGGLPEDGIVTAWRSGDEARGAVLAGKRVVNVNQDVLYFDHYQGPEASEPEAFGGFTPLSKVYQYDPMPSGLTQVQQALVLGGQGQLWSEHISTRSHLEYMAFPRALALAERLWTPAAASQDYAEFLERLQQRLPDLEKRGVNYRKLDQ